MISLEKWSILTPLQKLPVGDLGKLIVAQKLAQSPINRQSGHTESTQQNLKKLDNGHSRSFHKGAPSLFFSNLSLAAFLLLFLPKIYRLHQDFKLKMTK